MQKRYSTMSYILWAGLTCSIGFAVIALGFIGTEKIFAYTTTNNISEDEPVTPDTGTPSVSVHPSTSNPALQEALRIAFTKAYLTANASQSDTPIPLLDTDQFKNKSCPDIPESKKEYPYYTRIDMSEDLGHYIPSYLVEIQNLIPTKEHRIICLDETAAMSLNEMLAAAREDGHDIVVTSGFRDYDTQNTLYKNSLKNNAASEFLHVAAPGHSEHQLGLAVDLAGATMNYDSASAAFGDTPEGIWLQEHAGAYGFIMSYQEGAEEVTGIIYEPWHWRFIGTK